MSSASVSIPGPDDFDIAPDFLRVLSFAKGEYNAPCGKVRVHWKRENDIIRLSIEAPDDAAGWIVLPAGYRFCRFGNDRVDGMSILKLQSGEFFVTE